MNLSADNLPVVEFIFSIVMSTHLPGIVDMPWGYVVGAAGSGKTELVNPYRYLPDFCFMLSSLTENALLSGYSDDEGSDPSLIPKLDGKVLIIKDFTSIMCDNPNIAKKVYGQLRDAYDGYCSKASGKDGTRSYESRFGVVACVTPEIDNYAQQNQQLGERFIYARMNRYPLTATERLRYLAHVRSVALTKTDWRNEITMTVASSIRDILSSELRPPEVNQDVGGMIDRIADCVGILRTCTLKGNATESEMPSRLVNQLSNLAMSRAICDGRTEVNESDVAFLRRVAIDTLPEARRRLIQLFYDAYVAHFGHGGITLDQLKDSGIATQTLDDSISQFVHNYIILSSTTTEGTKQYRLSKPAYEHFRESGLFLPGAHNSSKRG
jgi:hypothetical protein